MQPSWHRHLQLPCDYLQLPCDLLQVGWLTVRYSRMAALYTAAVAPTRPLDVTVFFRNR